jgi:hypothetical protein
MALFLLVIVNTTPYYVHFSTSSFIFIATLGRLSYSLQFMNLSPLVNTQSFRSLYPKYQGAFEKQFQRAYIAKQRKVQSKYVTEHHNPLCIQST